jgi:tryptophan-rich sensory protein
MNAWYQQLSRPPLTPPPQVFSPVWFVLYATILASVVLWVRSSPKPHARRTSLLLAVHLLSNLAWTPLFFGLQSPWSAFADIVVLDATLVLLIRDFRLSSRPAALLLVPYLAWVLFATYLNLGFAVLN